MVDRTKVSCPNIIKFVAYIIYTYIYMLKCRHGILTILVTAKTCNFIVKLIIQLFQDEIVAQTIGTDVRSTRYG